MNARRVAILAAPFALVVLGGCTHTVTPAPFTPTGSARSNAAMKLEAVRYLQQAGVEKNEVEFHKAGKVVFEKPIADLVREGILKELANSGFRLGDGGGQLWVDVKRCTLLDKFTSLEFAIETNYRLQVGQKTVSRDLRASRRHGIYTAEKKALDLNAMVSETYEVFFTDPEVKMTLLTPPPLVSSVSSAPPPAAAGTPLPALAVGSRLFANDGTPFGTVVLMSDTEVAVALSGGGTVTMTKEQATRMQR